MLISQLAIVVNASQVEGLTEKTKITNQLKEKMDSAEEGEYIPIYIWLNSHDDFVVYEALSRTYSERINADNEQMLIDGRTQKSLEELKAEVDKVDKEESQGSINTKFDKKKKHIRENTALGSKLSDSQIERFLGNEDEQREIVANVEQTQYISEWRSARYNINQFINREFEKRLNMEKCRNVNLDIQLAFVELEATKDYIYELEKLYMVESIGLLLAIENYEMSSSSATELETVYPEYHLTKQPNNYAGDIKIGVIEVAKEKDYDGNYKIGIRTSAPHLNNKTKIYRYESQWSHRNDYNNLPNNHATNVLTILIGNEVELDQDITTGNGEIMREGTKYSGIAPDASVYYTCFDYTVDEDLNNNPCSLFELKRSIYWCINSGVDVINMSFQSNNGCYAYVDQYVDCIVTEYRISVVACAGNKEDSPLSNVTSPAMAYNVISVGNMTAKLDDSNKYIINQNSCYEERSFLTNKPDICAFGTNICMLDLVDDYTNLGVGTGYAAPMVTGTIAIMMQENPQLIGNPEVVKSILLNTATTNVSTIENPVVEADYVDYYSNLLTANQVMREKTGAGLLNIRAAVNNARNIGQVYKFSLSANDESKRTHLYYFGSGQKVKATLVFEKNYYERINSANDVMSGLDLILNGINGNTAMMVFSDCNNVDLVEFTINTAGYYYFEISNTFGSYDAELQLPIYNGGTYETCYPSEYVNASLIFTCGCETSLLEETVGNEYHTISCTNDDCEFACLKMHDIATFEAYVSDGSVLFESKYLTRTNLVGSGYEFYYHNVVITTFEDNSQYEYEVCLYSLTEETVNNSDIEVRIYTITLKDESDNVVRTGNLGIRITKNKTTGKIYITNNG